MKELKHALRLQSVPNIDASQVTASQLATNGMDGNPIYKSDHIIVAVRMRDVIVAGRLESVTDSLTVPLLVLRIGQVDVAVHPAHSVTVAPEGHRLTVVAQPLAQKESM